jgi:hypothetical protein
MSNRNTAREQARLRLEEDGWNLVRGVLPSSSSTTATSRMTRNAGSGRFNPHIKRELYNESSSDSSYEADGESSSEEEVVEEYDDSDSEQQAPEEDDKKPPPTRLFLNWNH